MITTVYDPIAMEGAWRVFAAALQVGLRRIPGSEVTHSEIEHVLEVLKPLYLRAAQQIAWLPDSEPVSDPARPFNDYHGGVVTQLLLELAAREIQLQRLR